MKEFLKKYFGKIKLAITIIIIAGVAIHLVLVYNAANSIEITDKRIISLYPQSVLLDEYEVKFSLSIKNPKGTSIEVDYISYRVYIEDEFLGEGEKPHFSIDPGITNHTLLFSFTIYDLSSSTQRVLLSGAANVTIKGEVMIPAKFLGLFTWRHITIPYTLHERMEVASPY